MRDEAALRRSSEDGTRIINGGENEGRDGERGEEDRLLGAVVMRGKNNS